MVHLLVLENIYHSLMENAHSKAVDSVLTLLQNILCFHSSQSVDSLECFPKKLSTSP